MMFTKGDIKVDIIAAFSAEGEIIPLKIRFPDDNGEIETYKIVGYRETTEIGSKGFQPVLNFDIKIIDYGIEKKLHLVFFQHERIWIIRKLI